jgi:thymidylate synthase
MILHKEYKNVLELAIDSDIIEQNKRTEENIKVIGHPISTVVDLRNNLVPTIGLRKTFPKSAAAEIAWFLSGTQDPAFIQKYAPFWDKFVEKENGKDVIKSSYGYRWRNHFGRDQIGDAIAALKEDPTNRRVYISAWDAKEDGLLTKDQLNVPCPVGFNLTIINGKLNSTITLRSSDIFVGLPYDVMGHAYLMDAIATSLNVDLGFMGVSLNHAHLYEAHWDHTLEALKQPFIVPKLKLPGKSVEEITSNPDKYVLDIIEDCKNYQWPTFNPKPHVVSIKEDNQDVIEFLKKKNDNTSENTPRKQKIKI